MFPGIPEAESFCFSLNTLLSDIAAFSAIHRVEIFAAQTKLFVQLCESVQEHKKNKDFMNEETKSNSNYSFNHW